MSHESSQNELNIMRRVIKKVASKVQVERTAQHAGKERCFVSDLAPELRKFKRRLGPRGPITSSGCQLIIEVPAAISIDCASTISSISGNASLCSNLRAACHSTDNFIYSRKASSERSSFVFVWSMMPNRKVVPISRRA